jgi:hypothetical protein
MKGHIDDLPLSLWATKGSVAISLIATRLLRRFTPQNDTLLSLLILLRRTIIPGFPLNSNLSRHNNPETSFEDFPFGSFFHLCPKVRRKIFFGRVFPSLIKP